MYGMDNSESQCFNVGDPRGREGWVTDLQLVGTGEHFQSQSGHKTGSAWSKLFRNAFNNMPFISL